MIAAFRVSFGPPGCQCQSRSALSIFKLSLPTQISTSTAYPPFETVNHPPSHHPHHCHDQYSCTLDAPNLKWPAYWEHAAPPRYPARFETHDAISCRCARHTCSWPRSFFWEQPRRSQWLFVTSPILFFSCHAELGPF